MKRPASTQALPWLLFLLLLAAGCSSLNGTRLEPVLGADVNLVRLGDRVAESLLTQAVPPLLPNSRSHQPKLISLAYFAVETAVECANIQAGLRCSDAA